LVSQPDDDRDGEPSLVLVVEHEAAVAELARRYLERDGLSVCVAGTPADALAALRGGPPAVVILDLTMPGLTPGAVRRRLPTRGHPGGPELICLEGPGGLRPRHVGVAAEGDRRCLARPFSPRVLVARVRAALRPPPAATTRAASGCGPAGTSTLGELTLDTETRTVSVAGAEVCLTTTEFGLLAFLVEGAGRVFSRQQLLSAVRGTRAAAGTRAVDVHVAALRAKLGRRSPIRTVRGVGYAAEPPAPQGCT
jgi:DNA-binding response OmpR family regulator